MCLESFTLTILNYILQNYLKKEAKNFSSRVSLNFTLKIIEVRDFLLHYVNEPKIMTIKYLHSVTYTTDCGIIKSKLVHQKFIALHC